MEKMVLNENELAKRWGLSPKTLQRWRSEGRGPRYLKLSKRVGYLISEVLEFEAQAMYSATWEKGSDVVLSKDPNLMTAKEVADTTSIPMYVLTHPRVRESLGLPFLYVGKCVRFKLDEVLAWAKRRTEEMEAHGIEVPKDPHAQRRTLLEALARLPA
jgi:predicted DNA-binding transcriptional regulator AlpA